MGTERDARHAAGHGQGTWQRLAERWGRRRRSGPDAVRRGGQRGAGEQPEQRVASRTAVLRGGPKRAPRPEPRHLFFSLPLGSTVVTGGMGRSELVSLGGEVSFLGFFTILLLRWSDYSRTMNILTGISRTPSGSYAVSGALAAYIAETGGMKDHTVAQRAEARKRLLAPLEAPLPQAREHVLNAMPYMLRPGMEEWPDQRTANTDIKAALDARIGHEDDDRIARTILDLLEWFEIGDVSGHFGKLPTEETKAAPKK